LKEQVLGTIRAAQPELLDIKDLRVVDKLDDPGPAWVVEEWSEVTADLCDRSTGLRQLELDAGGDERSRERAPQHSALVDDPEIPGHGRVEEDRGLQQSADRRVVVHGSVE
jgi:hypothetical protein